MSKRTVHLNFGMLKKLRANSNVPRSIKGRVLGLLKLLEDDSCLASEGFVAVPQESINKGWETIVYISTDLLLFVEQNDDRVWVDNFVFEEEMSVAS